MGQGRAESADVAQTRDMLKQLAYKNLETVEGMTDDESFRRAAGIYRAVLSGREPAELAPFRSQFDEIETATQTKLRDIDAAANSERMRLSDTVPHGGARLRMLADISLRAQDEKAKAIGAARDTIRTKNMELKDKYMSEALLFGKTQPQQFMASISASANILQGLPTTGPSGSEQLRSADTGYTAAASTLGSLFEQKGAVDAAKPREAEYTQPTPMPPVAPSATKYIDPSQYGPYWYGPGE